MKDGIRKQMIAFLPRLRRFAYSLTGNLDEAEDLVQSTCERALARIDQWVPGTSLESWMFRITQNLWKDELKAKKARGQVLDFETMRELIGPDGRRETEGRLTLSAVTKSIAQLPEDQRVVIALVCIDGLSYKQVSEILEIPIGTVMSRLSRARKALYAAIYEQDRYPESSCAEVNCDKNG